jgi:bifunctional UDP-N-acetylglucosamine pyrophosphorylase/glucosamine-1-phosphate N-acetyltransferase
MLSEDENQIFNNMKNNDIAAIILAAGKGERMKSALPKVLHQLCCRPMLGYVTDLVSDLKIGRYVVVLGFESQQVKRFLPAKAKTTVQKKLLGTADAVKQALPSLKNFRGTCLVLYGDCPLLKKETIEKLIMRHIESKAAATLLTARLEKPFGYGRILRDKYSSICGIVEEKDADDFQKEIKEINTGIVCFDSEKLRRSLKLIRPNNVKKEYYLTDAIGIMYNNGDLVENVLLSDINEALGINSRQELAHANKLMQKRINEEYMKNGVTIVDPDSAWIAFATRIGRDSVIYPFTVIEKDVTIGDQCSVGPFAHLRPGTRLEDNVSVGNFIEISRSKIARKTRAKHFGYIGDSKIGASVNIGAGTVTANYDGENKNITSIGDKAFIGSDTVIVAPVRIGKGAKTGAGSVVTRGKNVADNSTVIGVPARPLKKN